MCSSRHDTCCHLHPLKSPLCPQWARLHRGGGVSRIVNKVMPPLDLCWRTRLSSYVVNNQRVWFNFLQKHLKCFFDRISLVFRLSLVCSKFMFSAGILFGMKTTLYGKPDLKKFIFEARFETRQGSRWGPGTGAPCIPTFSSSLRVDACTSRPPTLVQTTGGKTTGGKGRPPRPSCSVCVLLLSLLLAVNLAKEVKYRGSSIVANKKEVPLPLHSCFCLILYLFS